MRSRTRPRRTASPCLLPDDALFAQINELSTAEKDRLDQIGERLGVPHYCRMLQALFREEEAAKRDKEKRSLGGHRRVRRECGRSRGRCGGAVPHLQTRCCNRRPLGRRLACRGDGWGWRATTMTTTGVLSGATAEGVPSVVPPLRAATVMMSRTIRMGTLPRLVLAFARTRTASLGSCRRFRWRRRLSPWPRHPTLRRHQPLTRPRWRYPGRRRPSAILCARRATAAETGATGNSGDLAHPARAAAAVTAAVIAAVVAAATAAAAANGGVQVGAAADLSARGRVGVGAETGDDPSWAWHPRPRPSPPGRVRLLRSCPPR